MSSATVDFIMRRLDVAFGCKGLVQEIVALMERGELPTSRREAELRVEVGRLRVGANAALGTLQSFAAEHTYGYHKVSWALEPELCPDPDADEDGDPDNNPYDSNGDLILTDYAGNETDDHDDQR